MPQHQAFVDYFTHEFMEELWYLQKVTRGDIPQRVEADPWETFFNVTQGLLSLAPIPGLPLGFLLSKELVKKCLAYGEKGLKLARQAQGAAQTGYQKGKEFLEQVDTVQQGYEKLLGKLESKGMLQQEGPMDLTAIRVLVELVGRGLAERYEHVLSDYLAPPLEKSYIPLARVMAKRLFAYLQSQPLLSEALASNLLAQRTRLLNGIFLANVDKSWREKLSKQAGAVMPRVLKDMHKIALALQDGPKQRFRHLEKFTAENVIKRSAWYDEQHIYAHRKTAWHTAKKDQLALPKYGYAYLGDTRQKPPLEMKAVSGVNEPPRSTRYYCPVGIQDIQAYIRCPQMAAARAAHQACSYSFHDFLRDQGNYPKTFQAVCHDDLTAITHWYFANFQGVDFSGVRISGNLSGVNFSDSYLVGMTGIAVGCHKDHPVNFSGAQLGFADLRGAVFPRANFTQAELQLTNLSGANLTDIQCTGANWYKTDLTAVTRQDLLAEQARQVAETQRQFQARMRKLDSRISQLEQTIAPMLMRLDSLETQPSSADKTAAIEQHIAELQAQISKTANDAFYEFCKQELGDLRQRTEALRQDVDHLKVQVQDVGKLRTQLQQLETQLASQASLTSTGAGAGDIGRKILIEQTTVQLTHRAKDLEFYLPPTVIAAMPEKMSMDELMAYLNKLPQDTAAPEAKREHKVSSESPTAALAIPQRFDAIAVIDQFLAQEESLLLLLGEPGAGKSLSTWQATRRLIMQFQPGMSGAQISRCWLPIHIELNQIALSDLSGLIDRQLQAYGLNEAAIKKLKQTDPGQTAEPKVLLLLDGYDELQQEAQAPRLRHTDFFKRIGGESWKKGQLKVLVTCRRRYLHDVSEERMIFGVGQYQRYQRFELLPFTMQQVERYVIARSKADSGGGLLSTERYFQTITASESLKKLVSSPFVLQLFLETLPRLVQNGQDTQHITRFDLYQEFFNQWLEREVRRLTFIKKARLGRDSDVTLVQDFKRIARYLALSMYASASISVTFTKPSQATTEYNVWHAVLKQMAAETHQEFQALAAQNNESEEALFGLSPARPQPDKAIFMQHAQARVNQLAEILPLSRSGSSYKFVHKSFYEYLVAAAIIDLGQDDPAFETATLEFLKGRLIQTEPAVVDFLSELSVQESSISQQRYLPLRSKLFRVIQRSARRPGLGQASSNAATILNACQEPLSGQSWAKVQLAGADLRYCNLAHTDLSGANLQGASLGRSILYRANLTAANLCGVSWGEYPHLKLKNSNTIQSIQIAHHPLQPWLAFAKSNTILLIHRDSGEHIGQPMKAPDTVTSIAFNPNGDCLAASCGSDFVIGGKARDNTICLWNVASQTAMGEPLRGHKTIINCIIFSPDGRYLASGSSDHSVHLWEVDSYKLMGILIHAKAVRSIAFNASSTLLASGSGDYLKQDKINTVCLWDVASQKRIGVLHGRTDVIRGVAFSPDEMYLVSAGRDGIRLWDVKSQTLLSDAINNHKGVSSIAFSPDGQYLAVGSDDNSICLWDPKSQTPRGVEMMGHTQGICGLIFTPDGSRLYSADSEQTIRIWEVAGQAPLVLPLKSLDKNRLLISNRDNEILRVLHLESQTPQMRAATQSCLRRFSPNGKYLAAAANDYEIQLWDVASQRQLGSTPMYEHTRCVSSLAFSPDSRRLATANNGSQALGPLKIMPDGRLAFESITRRVAPSAADASSAMQPVKKGPDYGIRLWDVEGQFLLGTMHGHVTEVNCVTFSPNGALLASGSGSYHSKDSDNAICLWNVASQTRINALSGHAMGVCDVTFSPDGRRLASRSKDGVILIWDVASQTQLGTALRVDSGQSKIAFSPDGRHLAALGNQRVWLWKLAEEGTGTFVAILPWNRVISKMSFTPVTQGVIAGVREAKSLTPGLGQNAEDILVISDTVGTISFWAIARQDSSLRFVGMPKHNGMSLMFNEAQLSGCQMSAMSKRLLEQHGADVSKVVVIDEAASTIKADAKQITYPKIKARIAPPTRRPPLPPGMPPAQAPVVSGGGFFPTAAAERTAETSPAPAATRLPTLPTRSHQSSALFAPVAQATTVSTLQQATILEKAQRQLAMVEQQIASPEHASHRAYWLRQLEDYQRERERLTEADYQTLTAMLRRLKAVQTDGVEPKLGK